jgi:hypothetical protein
MGGIFVNGERIKGLIAGFLLCAVLSSGLVVLANTVTRNVTYGVGVTLDGAVLSFDADSQPFVSEGRTFLPVRAIADALGMEIDFDAGANMVYLQSYRATSGTPLARDIASGSGLAGVWYWEGHPYYILHPDGTGFVKIHIHWDSTDDGVFVFCTTPLECGGLSDCSAPEAWHYRLDGDTLRLTNVILPEYTFYYTRN